MSDAQPHNTVQSLWTSFYLAVTNQGALQLPPDQTREMRRAFYAGAQGLFHEIVNGLDPGEDATEADLARMSAISDELSAFARAVESGRA